MIAIYGAETETVFQHYRSERVFPSFQNVKASFMLATYGAETEKILECIHIHSTI